MNVRPATSDDLNDVARILSILRMTEICAADIEEIFNKTVVSRDADIMLGLQNGQVVGMAVLNCVLKLNRIECRVDDVIVDPSARGSGIGTLLFEACDQWAWDKDCYKIEFTSRAARERGQNFYHKLGYELRDSSIFVKFSPHVAYEKTNYQEEKRA